MSNPRISIATMRQLIQLQSGTLSTGKAARALNLSQGAFCKYASTVRSLGLGWEDVQELDDAELERRICPQLMQRAPRALALPDCTWIQTELKRHKHVALHLLWEEYQAKHGAQALRDSALLRTLSPLV